MQLIGASPGSVTGSVKSTSVKIIAVTGAVSPDPIERVLRRRRAREAFDDWLLEPRALSLKER